MAFSYSPQLPSARDRVRHAIGDTDAAAPLRQDETIDALLGLLGEDGATAALAEGLAAEYARKPDSVGADGSTVTWRERVKTWLELASRTRGAAGATGAQGGSFVAGRGDPAHSEYLRPERGGWWTG